MSGGPVPARLTRPGRHRLDHRRSSLSRPPQGGLGADPAGHLDRLDERRPGPSPGLTRQGRHPLDPRRSSLSRPPQRRLGADPAGHLDRLDERWPGPSPGLTRQGRHPLTPAGRARRDHRSQGWEPTLRHLDRLDERWPGPSPGVTRPRRLWRRSAVETRSQGAAHPAMRGAAQRGHPAASAPARHRAYDRSQAGADRPRRRGAGATSAPSRAQPRQRGRRHLERGVVAGLVAEPLGLVDVGQHHAGAADVADPALDHAGGDLRRLAPRPRRGPAGRARPARRWWPCSAIADSTPLLDEAGPPARSRILAWMPRSTRCWLAERSKSPRSRLWRIRENASAR